MKSGVRQACAAAVVILLSSVMLGWGYAAAALVDLDEPPRLDVNSHRFADSSLVDFSRELAPPAGERGFLTVNQEGQFCFGDGQRMRFWGINVAKQAVFQPHDTIEAAAELFARAGFNLVRLHHLDDVGGLLPPERVGHVPRLDPEKLDAVDYWVAALKKRGIYVYLDLLDYRTFWEEEGVANGSLLGRGAKPYAVFSDRLIELQIDYARELLVEHTNPYTGLSYAQDPAVVLVELCDENGLFAAEKRWRGIMPPYRRELLERWNGWLRPQYRTTEELAQAWRQPGRPQPLAGFESLDAGTVSLPGIALAAPASQARREDARRFAAQVHRDYFQRMRQALRQMGVQVPISAVTDFDYPADVGAVAAELDFTAANYYFAHPFFKADRPAGVLGYFEASSPLTAVGADRAVRRLCGPRVAGKPLVIREWNVCWPNPYRAEGILQAAQYGAAQDIDAMILFTYGCQPGTDKLSYFDLSADPARWGLAALAGHVFRTGPTTDAPLIQVVFSENDIFESSDGTLADEVYDMGLSGRMVNWLPGCPLGPADFLYLRPDARRKQVQILAQFHDARPVIIDGPSDLPALQRRSDRFAFVGGQEDRPESAKATATQTPTLAVGSGSLDGTLAWCSLDGEPATSSQAWVLKHVGRAENTGQRSRPHFVKEGRNLHALLEDGIAPVVTGGQGVAEPLSVRLAGKRVVSVYLRGGVWELVRDGDDWLFFCDMPGAKLTLPQLPGLVEMTAFAATGVRGQMVTQPVVYPAEALMIRLRSLEGTE